MDAGGVWDNPVTDGYQKAVVQPEADMSKMMCSPAVLQQSDRCRTTEVPMLRREIT